MRATPCSLELLLGTDQEANTIKVLQPILRVAILAVDRDRPALTVADLDGKMPPETLPLTPKASIRAKAVAVPFAELRPGLAVQIRLTADGTAIEAVQVGKPGLERADRDIMPGGGALGPEVRKIR